MDQMFVVILCFALLNCFKHFKCYNFFSYVRLVSWICIICCLTSEVRDNYKLLAVNCLKHLNCYSFFQLCCAVLVFRICMYVVWQPSVATKYAFVWQWGSWGTTQIVGRRFGYFERTVYFQRSLLVRYWIMQPHHKLTLKLTENCFLKTIVSDMIWNLLVQLKLQWLLAHSYCSKAWN